MSQSRAPVTDFEGLIRRCCEENCEENFSEFHLVSRDYLIAALTRFSGDWRVVEAVCDATYQDYRQLFQVQFNGGFDYRNCFYAIGYAHLVRHCGSQPLYTLVSRALGKESFSALDKKEIVAVFFAILHLPGDCRFYLFEACFPRGQSMIQQEGEEYCHESLRSILLRILA